ETQCRSQPVPDCVCQALRGRCPLPATDRDVAADCLQHPVRAWAVADVRDRVLRLRDPTDQRRLRQPCRTRNRLAGRRASARGGAIPPGAGRQCPLDESRLSAFLWGPLRPGGRARRDGGDHGGPERGLRRSRDALLDDQDRDRDRAHGRTGRGPGRIRRTHVSEHRRWAGYRRSDRPRNGLVDHLGLAPVAADGSAGSVGDRAVTQIRAKLPGSASLVSAGSGADSRADGVGGTGAAGLLRLRRVVFGCLRRVRCGPGLCLLPVHCRDGDADRRRLQWHVAGWAAALGGGAGTGAPGAVGGRHGGRVL
ncbi:MAG: hypothetical protein AVDCRST_MAG87-3883, partial [uncultured Thermomicrobiales bacterium]